MVNFIELPVNPMEITQELPFLADYFPNIFANALVPLNPQRWLAYLAGSAMAWRMIWEKKAKFILSYLFNFKYKIFLKMGTEGLEPSRLSLGNGF